jgi:hypothetical protein
MEAATGPEAGGGSGRDILPTAEPTQWRTSDVLPIMLFVVCHAVLWYRIGLEATSNLAVLEAAALAFLSNLRSSGRSGLGRPAPGTAPVPTCQQRAPSNRSQLVSLGGSPRNRSRRRRRRRPGPAGAGRAGVLTDWTRNVGPSQSFRDLELSTRHPPRQRKRRGGACEPPGPSSPRFEKRRESGGRRPALQLGRREAVT